MVTCASQTCYHTRTNKTIMDTIDLNKYKFIRVRKVEHNNTTFNAYETVNAKGVWFGVKDYSDVLKNMDAVAQTANAKSKFICVENAKFAHAKPTIGKEGTKNQGKVFPNVQLLSGTQPTNHKQITLAWLSTLVQEITDFDNIDHGTLGIEQAPTPTNELKQLPF